MRVWTKCWFRGERGSLPLALLAIIMVAGIIVVLVSRTIATQNQVRYDQGFHASLPVADAGVDLGKFFLNNGTELRAASGTALIPGESCDNNLYKPADFPVGCTTDLHDREIEGEVYSFTLTRISAREWEVDSVGEHSNTGVERRVVGTIQELPLVNVALFADTILNFAGGNAADSYNSDPSVTDPIAAWCTGQGFIASNGLVDLNGVQGGPCHTQYGLKRTVDRVFLHNDNDTAEGNPIQGATDEYPGGDRCVHSGGGADGANCREVSSTNPEYLAPDTFEEPLKYTTTEEKAFIGNALAACEDTANGYVDPVNGSTVGTWTASDRGAVLEPGTFDPDQSGWAAGDRFEFPGELADLDVGFHCFSELIFDADTLIDATTDEPVIVVVGSEGVTIQGHIHVGCEVVVAGVAQAVKCKAGGPGVTDPSRPEAARLWIFTDGEITARQHSAFAGVIWAPNAVCGGGAQVHIYGSLICDDASNVGGWRFHYDEALADVSSGAFYTSSWREEPRN